MKKKFLIASFLSIATICLPFAFVGCGGGEKSAHVHDYDTTYKSDANLHWYECKNEGCDAKEKDKEAHLDSEDDGICDVCGYVIKVVHKHAYATTLSKGTYSHWYECTNSGCDAKIKDKTTHADSNNDNKCDVCGTSFKYSEGLEYSYLGDSYALVSKGQCTDTNIIVPPTYKGKSVTHIGNLMDDRELNSLTNVTSLTIPDSITSAVKYVFTKCEIQYNEYNNALYLGNDANPYVLLVKAKDKQITTCSINENTSVIAYSAFLDCKELTTVNMPESVKYIGQQAFKGCDKLQYNEYDNAMYLGNAANPYHAMINPKDEKIKTCIVNENTKILADNAFLYTSNIEYDTNCYNLTNITLGKSLTHIGERGVGYCLKLPQINIPENVVYIGIGAFDSDMELSSITVSPDNTHYTSVDGALYNKTKTTLYYVPKTTIGIFTVPEGVKEIGHTAFQRCPNIPSVNIPNSVVSIGYQAFSLCTGLKTMVIPDSVTQIGAAAFLNCAKIVTLTISKNIDYIERYSFRSCQSLLSVVIPDGIKVIAVSGFTDCLSLTSVKFPDSIEVIDHAFGSCKDLEKITIPASMKSMYATFTQMEELYDITYMGTKEQWEQIRKDVSWGNRFGKRYNFTYTVHCTDGDLTIKNTPLY